MLHANERARAQSKQIFPLPGAFPLWLSRPPPPDPAGPSAPAARAAPRGAGSVGAAGAAGGAAPGPLCSLLFSGINAGKLATAYRQ